MVSGYALIFPIGSTNGSVQCINISIIDDDEIEGDETFEITIFSFTVMIRNQQTVITIIDNEG